LPPGLLLIKKNHYFGTTNNALFTSSSLWFRIQEIGFGRCFYAFNYSKDNSGR
jgi:hypothetical protein